MAGISILLCSATAAAEVECELSIRAKGLDDKWLGAIEAARTALARRDDVDRCASIALERTAAGVRVIVALQDGRSTERRVNDPRDLKAIVTALVLLPEPPEPSVTDAPIAIETGQPPMPGPDAAVPTDRASSGPTVVLPSYRRPRLALGGVGGTRWSGTAPAGSVGGFANVRLDGWVLGAHARWDDYGTDATSTLAFSTQALEFGADFGRDLRIGGSSLTVLAGPRVALLSQRLQSTPPSRYVAKTNPQTGGPIGWVTPSARDGKVLRVGSAVRWSFLSARTMTLFLAADCEVDVMPDTGNSMPPALAATTGLPIWSAGLSLGGEVAVWP